MGTIGACANCGQIDDLEAASKSGLLCYDCQNDYDWDEEEEE